MAQLGIPQDAIAVVQGIYAGATTQFTCGAGNTTKTPVRRGTIQGDVLSPLLFLLALESLLRWLEVGGRGYRFGSTPADQPLTVPAGAYADDLNVLKGDLADMRRQITKIESFGTWLSLGVAPNKCSLPGILHRSASSFKLGTRAK